MKTTKVKILHKNEVLILHKCCNSQWSLPTADELLDYSQTVTKKHFIVERLLEIGLEEKKEYRELISAVLTKLVSTGGLTINQVGYAFSVSSGSKHEF